MITMNVKAPVKTKLNKAIGRPKYYIILVYL